jgi:endonuclease VIII
VIATDDAVAVCFNAPVVEILTARELERDEPLRRLGPDVLAAELDSAEAVRRLRSLGDTPIGEALLDQTALAGIGNIYKSETLFLCGADPFAPVSDFPAEELETILAKARSLMAASVEPHGLRLAGRGVRWVYRRSGEPCRRCGTEIRMRRQGTTARSTYWCPRCQPARAGAPA